MSISFFEAVYPEVSFSLTGDTQVCCPFPHTVNGKEYYEDRPSAGIHLEKGLFNCFSCGRAFNEVSFTAHYLNITHGDATRFLKVFKNSISLTQWGKAEKFLEESITAKDILKKLKISYEIRKELHLGCLSSTTAPEITIPIIMFGRVVDQVTYRPGQKPKYIRQSNSISGMPCPYDAWRLNRRHVTIVCAGEKDMMIARTMGFKNAISFTGGENNCPNLFLNEFKDRTVYIIYDNDDTGRRGSQKLAVALKNYARKVHIVDLSETCTEKGEDLWDYFCKYNKTKKDLVQLIENTPEFTDEDYKNVKQKIYPIIPLSEASKPSNINKILRSNIQVIATTDSVFAAPTIISGTKSSVSTNESSIMSPGERRDWFLHDNNLKDLFYLIDSNLKEKAINKHIKTALLGIPESEKNIEIKKEDIKNVHKMIVAEVMDASNTANATEFTAYSIGKALSNGVKYLITYKLIPHPQDGQKLIMVIKDVEETDDFLTNFKVTDDVKQSLEKFQPDEKETVEQKLNKLIELTKGIVKADYDNSLLKVIDLWYHTVLKFNVGSFKNIRGYLDTLLVGESRIGKSSTVDALKEMYGLGTVISLAGSAATMQGLIGGSSKVSNGSFQTRAGLIPQNNQGAIIFEELIKCKSDLIKELTDIRSSNKVRIVRVNGTIELPAFVRMLTLTNSKTHEGIPKPINSYPNGISLLTDIIGTPEDIARYDLIAIFGFEATKTIDPYYTPPTPLPQEDYRNRIRWIWSRKPEQVYISQSVYQYTIKKSNELNTTYGTYINIFGVEAWKKILRLGIAVAGYLCSTDDTFENIIVETEHIDEAVKLLVQLYDNSTFKLKEFVDNERKYNELSEDDVKVLQEIWKSNSLTLEYLFNNPQTNRVNLNLVSGLPAEDFSKIIYALVKNNLVRIDKTSIITTKKFIKGYNKINKDIDLSSKEVVFKIDF